MSNVQPKALNGTNVTTGKIRGSYVQVFEAKPGPDGGPPKYSMAVLIPKEDKATLALLKNAAVAAGVERFGAEKFTGDAVSSGRYKWPLRDGDKERPDDAAYKGHMFFNCRAAQKPAVIDRNRNPVGPEGFRSGDYARVNVNAFAFDSKKGGKPGVSFGLNSVQVLEAGEPLSGGPSVDAAFDALDEQAQASATGADGFDIV